MDQLDDMCANLTDSRTPFDDAFNITPGDYIEMTFSAFIAALMMLVTALYLARRWWNKINFVTTKAPPTDDDWDNMTQQEQDRLAEAWSGVLQSSRSAPNTTTASATGVHITPDERMAVFQSAFRKEASRFRIRSEVVSTLCVMVGVVLVYIVSCWLTTPRIIETTYLEIALNWIGTKINTVVAFTTGGVLEKVGWFDVILKAISKSVDIGLGILAKSLLPAFYYKYCKRPAAAAAPATDAQASVNAIAAAVPVPVVAPSAPSSQIQPAASSSSSSSFNFQAVVQPLHRRRRTASPSVQRIPLIDSGSDNDDDQ